MRHLLIWSLVVLGWIGCKPAGAETISISRTQPMLDFSGELPSVLPFALFNYSGQPQLGTLTGIEIRFTMEDGDSAFGQFDFNQLSLGLDTVSTGLLLNGFADAAESTLTFKIQKGDPGWIGDQLASTLLSNLNADNQLFASILDASPDDNKVNLYSANATILTLTGTTPGSPVPEPASLALWLGGAGVVLLQQRYRRSATLKRNGAVTGA